MEVSGRSSHSTYSLPDGSHNECNDVDINRVLSDITFVRVNLENVHVSDGDEYMDELIRSRCLYGFVIEYSFPSLDSVSTSLKARVRINSKSYSGSTINFRHRRVVRVKMKPEIVPIWRRERLKMTLYARLNTLGKYTIKLLGRCEVALRNLLSPPFIVHEDILFRGAGFYASSLIKIDLGSHHKSLMERLEWIRSGQPPQTLPEMRIRSSSPARQLSARSSVERRSPHDGSSPTRRLQSASPERTSRLNRSHAARYQPVSSRSSSSEPRAICAPATPSVSPVFHKYCIKLTVHSARRLPLIYDRRGEAVAPSTFVSLNGDDGRSYSSPVRAATTHPEFEWTQVFSVGSERQNLVLKLWRKCMFGADKVIGFVSIPLPPPETYRAEYEMSDLSTSDQAPLITISISTVVDPAMMDTPLLASSPPPRKTSPPLNMTREQISRKLRQNLDELEMMVNELENR